MYKYLCLCTIYWERCVFTLLSAHTHSLWYGIRRRNMVTFKNKQQTNRKTIKSGNLIRKTWWVCACVRICVVCVYVSVLLDIWQTTPSTSANCNLLYLASIWSEHDIFTVPREYRVESHACRCGVLLHSKHDNNKTKCTAPKVQIPRSIQPRMGKRTFYVRELEINFACKLDLRPNILE